MNYDNFDDILNQITNMTVVFDGNDDDGTRSFTGVDWFKFKGRNILSSFFSGNHWLGLGANEENLKPFRRDGRVRKFYREEGTLFNHYRFLKIRWEGYVFYNSETDANRLIYEVVFFDNQSFHLNIIKTPTTDRSATTLVSNKTYTIDLNQIVDRTLKVSFYAENGDVNGNDWLVSYDPFSILPPYACLYLLQSEDVYYTIIDNALQPVEIPELNAQAFLDSGFDAMPTSDLLKTLRNPKVLYWHDSEDELPTLQANITAIPLVQTLEHTVDMTHSSINTIDSLEYDITGNPTIAFSKDGLYWESFNGSEWVDGYGNFSAHSATVLNDWRGELKIFHVRVQLHENDIFTNFKLTYTNF